MPRLLLVDDNEETRALLADALEMRGFDVVHARDGEGAVSQTRTHRPDLVLMDMNMPIVDGWEATTRLKADGALAAIPVVALSANAMPGDSERALSLGCAGYLTKPVELEELMGLIEATLRALRSA